MAKKRRKKSSRTTKNIVEVRVKGPTKRKRKKTPAKKTEKKTPAGLEKAMKELTTAINNLQAGDKLTKQLNENLVALQKAETNMAEKFNNLSEQISKLFGLFEAAAKSFAENPSIHDRELAEKMDQMIAQTKSPGPAPPTTAPTGAAGPMPPRPIPEEGKEFRPPTGGRPLPRF